MDSASISSLTKLAPEHAFEVFDHPYIRRRLLGIVILAWLAGAAFATLFL
ncbi:MAG TPA: hypothetical protein VFG69_09900 [Nannocystaceae bacterium]|nr:hypothetical protein [Nannocystaceae bacterium]